MIERWLRRIGGLLLVSVFALCGCGDSTEDGDSSELLEKAWTRFRLGEYDSAVIVFESVRDASASPEDPNYARALYGLASIWGLRMPVGDQNRDLAREMYGEIIQIDSSGDLAAWSLLGLARLDHLVAVGSEPDYEKIQTSYQRVIDAFPSHAAAAEAFVYQQSTYVATLDKSIIEGAAKRLEAFIDSASHARFISSAWGILADCYRTTGEFEKRLNAMIQSEKTLEIDPSNPKQDKSWRYWSIATVAEFEVGDFETARRYYRRMMEEYPQDIRYFGAETALSRMDDLEAKLRAEIRAQSDAN